MSSLRQVEITDRQGARYQLRILPCRTIENKINGAIITIIDLSSYSVGEMVAN
jgi:hypothetical protein